MASLERSISMRNSFNFSSACRRSVMSSIAAMVRIGWAAASRITGTFPLTQISLPVFGVRELRDMHPQQLVVRVSGDHAHLLIHAQPPPGARIGLCHPDGGQLEHGA